jgi:hypothetical protein
LGDGHSANPEIVLDHYGHPGKRQDLARIQPVLYLINLCCSPWVQPDDRVQSGVITRDAIQTSGQGITRPDCPSSNQVGDVFSAFRQVAHQANVPVSACPQATTTAHAQFMKRRNMSCPLLSA